jgi:DNA modification methylase
VLDAFAGSGTTLVSAHKTGRRGYGIELDPHYCDVILRRMAAIAALDAVLVATGQSFAAVAAERGDAGEVDLARFRTPQLLQRTRPNEQRKGGH